MIKREAKEKIKQLIAKYEAEKITEKVLRYTEEETKRGFIEPLFETLGWDFSNREEITLEEHISGNRVDYGFYLNGRIKFYLEAKKISADLNREDYAEQAIRYSWNKGVTWAILTDFESLIVFNALSPEKSLAGKKYLSFTYKEYLNRFDELWRLSKEAFNDDILDKEAERVGKKLQKISVTETLSKDLNECREILTTAFLQWNDKRIDSHLIDEGVQKLLNRLIFIRCAEDRKIEPPTLVPLIHEWKSSDKAGRITPYQAMIKKFRELDIIYNSNLFDEHPFEKWEEFGGATEKVIDILYGKKNYYDYDFSIIPADVLGNVYENYLGHQLKKSKKEEHLDKNFKKRKEQGIYYTPKFIVDYIVENALGPILNKCRSISDLQKIKILDPACGSGSFLVAAMNLVIKKYVEFGVKPNGLLKIQILTNNIYGVDLDQQAVELARLNLLLNTFDSQTKLPNLSGNIENGNSLISGTDEELKKYFGKNFRDKNPFNWQEKFPEVFKQGGFDVIIGNPPYVTSKYGKISENVKKFYIENFESAYDKLDLYVLFIEKALKISKEYGLIAFITPWNFLANFYSLKIRKFLLDNTKIKLFNKLPPNVFGGVIVDSVIFVFEKNKNNKGNLILFDDLFNENNQKHLSQDIYLQNEKYVFNFPGNIIAEQILNKMRIDSIELGKIALNYIGIMTGGQKEMIANNPIFKNSKPVLSGKDIDSWIYFDRGNFVNFDKSKIHSNDKESIYLSKKKILLRKTGSNLVACIDKNQFFTIQSLYNIIVKDKKYLEEYLLSLLNSKLFTYIYNKFFITNPEVFPYIKRRNLDKLPIKILSHIQQKPFIELADKMILLNKELRKTTKNSDKWEKIKSEIEKTDKIIDEKVYKLYGLTPEEIKIIENSK
ncbi:N-6 DNA methylase [Patescibacteria group bacterium]|nr:N-6 DNA methylase [Patescibacteria group bacterium]MBU4458864.1 N-6 DNA methylase [Patescibacteria group bacterium]MCG2696149.1 N-6 DNA methylase [Candidatus Portnoybacteria bacterium]